jgi:hypothetical protein
LRISVKEALTSFALKTQQLRIYQSSLERMIGATKRFKPVNFTDLSIEPSALYVLAGARVRVERADGPAHDGYRAALQTSNCWKFTDRARCGVARRARGAPGAGWDPCRGNVPGSRRGLIMGKEKPPSPMVKGVHPCLARERVGLLLFLAVSLHCLVKIAYDVIGSLKQGAVMASKRV